MVDRAQRLLEWAANHNGTREAFMQVVATGLYWAEMK